MLKAIYIFVLIVFFTNSISAQKDTVNLREVEITSNRISLPFSKKSRSIRVVTSNEIVSLPATNVADLLQSIAGIDVRRRGIDGMQSDLYIRGGNFDQTLVLIDGVKMDDIQTGHHTMNAIISLENIDRIEIIKGPAARIYGQNAFTGAINIVTKNVINNSLNLNVNYGSFENKKGVISLGQKYNNGNILASLSYQESDGYRFNTDFQNMAVFIKSTLSVFTLTASFTSRKFGANGFYASPDYIDQYEETQTSLVALSTKFENESIKIMPRLYWRRNEDMYLFLRQDPSFFRNLHISNKIGVENNVVINSNLGK
ncbi:MAG: TonB-dependent receptor, partial [Lutibacter sp.]|uniref:TonB-dependent receptor n=1 Tax=Lutibacter sp. TaxID=1925666 RepID=UPI00185E7959